MLDDPNVPRFVADGAKMPTVLPRPLLERHRDEPVVL